mmetsp:Transcript_108498/g.338160  ORF Transcript_108498/g.338160 Transcript_108498/m.338160 type:complete len:318 (+) Transcript_108498:718-1671(+)
MFSTLLFHWTSFHSKEFARTFFSSTELRSCCFRSSSSSEAVLAVGSTEPELPRWLLLATRSCCFNSATTSLWCLSMEAMARLNSSTRDSAMRLASRAPQSCCQRFSFTESCSASLEEDGRFGVPLPACCEDDCADCCCCCCCSFRSSSLRCSEAACIWRSCWRSVANWVSLAFISSLRFCRSRKASSLVWLVDTTSSMSLATFEACRASFSASSSFTSSATMWSSASFSFSSSILDFISSFCWTTTFTTCDAPPGSNSKDDPMFSSKSCRSPTSCPPPSLLTHPLAEAPSMLLSSSSSMAMSLLAPLPFSFMAFDPA